MIKNETPCVLVCGVARDFVCGATACLPTLVACISKQGLVSPIAGLVGDGTCA
jgi:hypothetical protein